MKELKTEDQNIPKLEKYLEWLVEHIQSMKDPSERQASIAFCIANLVSQNCGEIEGLGLLEKVKDILAEIGRSPRNSHKQVIPLSYIS